MGIPAVESRPVTAVSPAPDLVRQRRRVGHLHANFLAYYAHHGRSAPTLMATLRRPNSHKPTNVPLPATLIAPVVAVEEAGIGA